MKAFHIKTLKPATNDGRNDTTKIRNSDKVIWETGPQVINLDTKLLLFDLFFFKINK